jgi:hypothetical protein
MNILSNLNNVLISGSENIILSLNEAQIFVQTGDLTTYRSNGHARKIDKEVS